MCVCVRSLTWIRCRRVMNVFVCVCIAKESDGFAHESVMDCVECVCLMMGNDRQIHHPASFNLKF